MGTAGLTHTPTHPHRFGGSGALLGAVAGEEGGEALGFHIGDAGEPELKAVEPEGDDGLVGGQVEGLREEVPDDPFVAPLGLVEEDPAVQPAAAAQLGLDALQEVPDVVRGHVAEVAAELLADQPAEFVESQRSVPVAVVSGQSSNG